MGKDTAKKNAPKARSEMRDYKAFKRHSAENQRAICICIASTGVRFDFEKFELADRIAPIMMQVNPHIRIFDGNVVDIRSSCAQRLKEAIEVDRKLHFY